MSKGQVGPADELKKNNVSVAHAKKNFTRMKLAPTYTFDGGQ